MKIKITDAGMLTTLQNHLAQFKTLPDLALEVEATQQTLERVIQTELWPQAARPTLIIKTDNDKQLRARSIVAGFTGPVVQEKRILDYGCGEGHVALELAQQGAVVTGYDPEPPASQTAALADGNRLAFYQDITKVAERGPFDLIVVYDVIDHMSQHPDISKLAGLLSKDGQIKVRCHPFISLHGGHLYYTINKAYAHLFAPGDYSQFWQCLDPLASYRELWKRNGLIVKSEQVTTIDVPTFFSGSIIEFLRKKFWNNDPCVDIRQLLGITFVDYELQAR